MPRGLKPLGIGDLIVIRKKLVRYEAGEIAHIENVMGKEHRIRNHRRFHQVETTLIEEIEREEENRRDLESTERFELENEIKQEVKKQEKFSAGLEVSGGFGPVQLSAYAKYDRSESVEESEKSAQKYAKEITEKAMERVKERKREERKSIELLETEETNEHKFENDTSEHITGVYRWVDKYYLVKPVNYGKRLFYEVVIPEPAALFLFARTWNLENKQLPKKPSQPTVPTFTIPGLDTIFWYDGEKIRTGEPGPLRPHQIHDGNYSFLISEYGAEGVSPPPAEKTIVSHSISKEFDPTSDWVLEGEQIPIPEGYEAISCQYKILIKSWRVHSTVGSPSPLFMAHPYDAGWPGYGRIHIGQNTILQWNGLLGPPWGDYPYTIDLHHERGVVPLSGTGDRVGTLAMNFEVECQRTEEAMAEWQLATYRAIMKAYKKQLLEYEDRVTAAKVSSGVQISGDNPERNLLTIKEELKRSFLALWMGADIDLLPGLRDGRVESNPPTPPEIIEANVLANSDKISFAEEAFDWDNMSFRLLPYFYGRKNKWFELSNYTDTDPLFENFLKSGSALVRVPVVPEYTHAVLYYQLTEDIWSRFAGEIPALSDVSSAPEVELYNSFLAEVDPKEEDTDIHRVVDINEDDPDTFEIKVPTSLVWLQPGGDLNP